LDQLSFLQLRERIFDLYAQQRWQDALGLIEQQAPHVDVPAQAASIVFWRACFLARSGHPDEAIQALQGGMERGFWWSELRLRNDHDLKTLQGKPAFEKVVEECVNRHRQAEQTPGEKSRIVAEPSGTPPYPVLLALHGYSSNAVMTLPDWSPLAEHGWLVAALQSSQVAEMDGYHWVNAERTRDEVRYHLDALSASVELDRDRLAIAGFSNGGRAALTLGLTQAIPARWVVSVGGSLLDETLATVDWSTGHMPRSLAIVGEFDAGRVDRIRDQVHTFHEHGVDATFQLVSGIGHSVPDDLVDRVLGWMRSGG
jgi:predicted esterase